MKLLDVFLFVLYGAATGYAVYFIASIYNKPATVVVYKQPYPETIVYPWNGYNWYPYWGGWWSGGGDGGYGGKGGAVSRRGGGGPIGGGRGGGRGPIGGGGGHGR